jgi:hypothetical protein
MTAERRAGSGIAKLLVLALALGASAGVRRWARPSPQGDPVGVLRAVAMRNPMIRQDLPLDRYGAACDGGDGAACTELGVAWAQVVVMDGIPVPACVDHALFARACEEGHWLGCDHLARGGDDCGEPDLARAEAVLDRACAGAVFAACDALGRVRVRRRG